MCCTLLQLSFLPRQIVLGINDDISALATLAPELQPHLVAAPSWGTPSSNPIVGLRYVLLNFQV
jgi:hypothetical protein